jgi:hypothetical protein
MDQIMAKPRKAENHMITGKPILKVGGSNFKAPGALNAPWVRKKLSAVAAPGNIAADFAPLHDVMTVMGSSFDFVFSNLDIQDLNVGKIQQLPDLDLRCDALNNDCWFMTTISRGISRQLPKSQIFDRRGAFFITAMISPVTKITTENNRNLHCQKPIESNHPPRHCRKDEELATCAPPGGVPLLRRSSP